MRTFSPDQCQFEAFWAVILVVLCVMKIRNRLRALPQVSEHQRPITTHLDELTEDAGQVGLDLEGQVLLSKKSMEKYRRTPLFVPR